MKLIPLPAFDDNYIWMLHDGQGALVVDPGDAQPVLEALAHHALQLAGILVTHHHADHTGGVNTLRDATGAQVFGPAHERMPEPLRRLSADDRVELLGCAFKVLDVPGHTAGHIAYYSEDVNGHPLVFCGDTLFSGGCGRLFEGTAQQLNASLTQLAALPDDTVVCCTHEYTLSNLKFALEVEPQNISLQQYQHHCKELRAQGLPTLPSTIALEKCINPFLRCDRAVIQASAHRFDAAAVQRDGVFATLRQWKNQYQ
ncbi:hydroxyacylglutathione hydrolase [Rhodoferax aquaticus]|uniref:Hydroxyacylglutathione hydrolase n=1 Tax=Rhodoferax aquaticus TaxID=2527691 RepID=A0A515EQB5_9BURK|nr:hydroxyacylglutathione hydrolase [Rhodoferax aquaticus]QDL54868.1 hydroxyacylglutathione hydrolase [Rhodoferax aquaticus]